ncbi:MAG: ribokinase [Granulosicoccus sp.]
MKVFNFGSINIDLVYRVPHLVKPGETLSSRSLQTVLGGKGANQSVALARAGAQVLHVGCIGQSDEWASLQMQTAGVDISNVETIEEASGHAIIQVDDAGENSIILHGGANQSFGSDTLEKSLDAADSGDWLLIQNECNNIALAIEIAARKGMSIAFNPAPMTDDVKALALEHCALLILNETEAATLAETDNIDHAAELMAKRWPDTRLVLTLGAKGAVLRHGNQRQSAEALKIDVVDTTGAGDTFVGYFLAALIDGLDDLSALQRACAAAALSVTKPGATPSIPTADEVNAFLS